MTWKEFKDRVEAQGVTDNMEMLGSDTDLAVDTENVTVWLNDDQFLVYTVLC